LRFSVLTGLKLGRGLTENEQKEIARVIVEDLESYNWQTEREPASKGSFSVDGVRAQ
jgi:hypothetical protein